ncbi:MAG: filamentous hemagglutinin N-terminal domain-containing protein [Gammaproteobacteria bacterium]|nr:filamentous hemagglutinin N-terminal domain-containing protein [Gammaproteobacteria bacterium]
MSPEHQVDRVRPPLASVLRAVVLGGALVSSTGVAPIAVAGPTGGKVVAGSGHIQRPDASTTVIRQQSRSLAIDWTGFDVAGHERVQFQQPSASAAALNRVFSQLPSEIHGSITANGRIFIINPNGVIFGPGARVEVGGLMASTLDIDIDDFMSGRYRFDAPHGFEPGAIVNRGLIEAASGGGVALLGGSVHNDGVIVADLGHVVMAAGRHALVDFDGDGLIRFHVDGDTLDAIEGGRGAVVNSGEIRADGGQVLLSASLARGIVDRAVNNEGIIRAAGIERSAGSVRLSASGGAIENSGTIDVSARGSSDAGSVDMQSDTGVVQRGRIHADADAGDAGRVFVESAGVTLLDEGSSISARALRGEGGEVRALGASLAMRDGATVDVSGGFAGGTVLIGGDYRGANASIRNARTAHIAMGARIHADATDNGDGGRVVVWSDEATEFHGRLSARGGPSGGDGGFAEVSGGAYLAYRGSTDLGAAAGRRGTLLLDPERLVIVGGSDDGDSSVAYPASQSNGSVGEMHSSDSSWSVIYQSEIEAQSALADISLEATRSIATAGIFDDGALVLAPDSSLLIETRNLGAGERGSIDLVASQHGGDLDIVTRGTGTITIRTGVGGDRDTPIYVPNLISASDIDISAGGGAASPVMVFGTLSGANVGIEASGAVTVVSGARIVAGGDGTTLRIDASKITIGDGTPGAASLANSGTGSVLLDATRGTNVVLGEHAIANGIGLLSIGAGHSIVAVNLTDVSDTSNEIVSAGRVSLQASKAIGSDAAHVEMSGVTDLTVELDAGDLYVSASDGIGGPGHALSSLTLVLEPRSTGEYVIENFAGQIFDFAQGGFGDDLVIGTLTSVSPMDLSVTTVDEGIVIGGTDAAGIDLAAGGNVALDSAEGIREAHVDDGVEVVAEITADGRITLVARGDIGATGLIDVAAGAGEHAALEARSSHGAVRVNGIDALRIEGTGVAAADGGRIAAARGLTIAADVVSNADMTFSADADKAGAGNDLMITEGARVALEGDDAATLRFEAGDDIVFDGGSIVTSGSAAHQVVLVADSEHGGSDGITGVIAQTGAQASVTGARVHAVSGGGIDVQTSVAALSADNTTSGDVRVVNAGNVDLGGAFRNRAEGGMLALTSVDGGIDSGAAEVSSNAGGVTLETRRETIAGGADVIVGSGGVYSAGGDITVTAVDDIRLEGTLDSGAGTLSLEAGSAIEQLAGRIAGASVRSRSTGDLSLSADGNAIERLALSTLGDADVHNGIALDLDASDVSGDLDVVADEGVRVAGPVVVAGSASITSVAGDVDGAGGHIEAGALDIDAGGGIGVASPLEIDVAGSLSARSRGTGAEGDIRILHRGDFATRQLELLATDTASSQSVSLAAGNLLTVDHDPVDSPNLGPGDRLSLDGARIALAEKISGNDVDVRFEAPVDVTHSAFVTLDEGLLTFEGNVSPAADTTLWIRSDVVFASGHVTGRPGSTLIVEEGLDLVRDTTIEVDNLLLSGDPSSLTGSGSLTLLPATHGRDIVIGGQVGLVPDVTLATLDGFGGGRALNFGVPALPTSRSPFAGNVKVTRGLSVGDAVLTVGGLGDVMLDNTSPLRSDQRINIVAVGDRRVFPSLVAHHGGNIDDTNARPGAPVSLQAPVVNVIAQGRVGASDNALEVSVGSGGRVNFVTGADNVFINVLPAGASVNNVADTSPVLAAFQSQGFFLEALSERALARTVGLETTGLETTGLGELLYVDEGVFLLPEPYTTPVSATLLPALMDPDFPANRRPVDADDHAGWQAFYDGVLRDYVQDRYLVADDAPESERDEASAQVEREWRSLIEHFEGIRARERAGVAGRPAGSGGG